RADVRTVRAAFAASVGRRARWRARVFPPSAMAQTRSALRGAGTRAADLADRLNDLPNRMRRRTRAADLADRLNDLPNRMRRR
ncbi:hypothetical protein, partial [Actinomadura montaniterrae]|uniref:hypothetical protein n=1 Tax=Actinomadura montaniterrae TaxID=1803903 RepID=UPI00178C736B